MYIHKIRYDKFKYAYEPKKDYGKERWDDLVKIHHYLLEFNALRKELNKKYEFELLIDDKIKAFAEAKYKELFERYFVKSGDFILSITLK